MILPIWLLLGQNIKHARSNMRPVEKTQPDEQVTYTDSCGGEVNHKVQREYPKYGDAKMPLIANIGNYCSYCERCRDVDALDIEHLVAKSRGCSATAWDNFLLCCKVCNSVKGKQIVDENNYHWPHKNNTFISFIYDETGRVKVNPKMSELSKCKAENLLDLIGLGRHKDTEEDLPTQSDFRWKGRYETWNLATRQRKLYLDGKIIESDVIDVALTKGYWSVWFTVFKDIDPILKRLITDFKGTSASCFDANNHYRPVERNPGCEDSV